MSLAFRLPSAASLLPAGLSLPAFRASDPLAEPIRLGMPHLAYGGLSETWLLKELGHRHWLLLARGAGREVPDFRDVDGATVYAAFIAVQVTDATLGAFREHDSLVLRSRLERISRTQFASRHELLRDGVPMGSVEMTSVFVKRKEKGRNRALARVGLPGFSAPAAKPSLARTAALAATIRAGRFAQHFGFPNSDGESGISLTVRPCPSQDFNGADFLYFASFQAFVDRAEWEALQAPAGLFTVARDMVFHSNVEIGEAVRIAVKAQRVQGDQLLHWCVLTRAADGARLADIFTRRAPAPR
ncbi:Pnap_2097 family protein [Roseixanthobacter glucoisosaccharinicivorans]|uniref:Pnap_2097 family protein n=1 Tax=Roseixanthobacter glucoisosaccharinicivorans TaxID=3119923 RepID=UPI003727376A